MQKKILLATSFLLHSKRLFSIFFPKIRQRIYKPLFMPDGTIRIIPPIIHKLFKMKTVFTFILQTKIKPLLSYSIPLSCNNSFIRQYLLSWIRNVPIFYLKDRNGFQRLKHLKFACNGYMTRWGMEYKLQTIFNTRRTSEE